MDDFLDLHLSNHNLIFQWSVLRTVPTARLGATVRQKGLAVGPEQSVWHIVGALPRLG